MACSDARVDRYRTVQLNSRFFDRERAAAAMATLVGECKAELATKMVDWLRPIQERRKALLAEPGKLDAILARGTERARAVARATMKEVREAVFKLR